MRNLFKVLFFSLTWLLLIAVVFESGAQTKKKIGPKSLRDSLKAKVLQRNAMIKAFKHTDDGSLNDLLGKIQEYTSKYIQTNSDLSRGFDTLDISQRLPTLERRMMLMRSTIDNSGTLGYLTTIRTMVDHISSQTSDWEDKLNKYSDQLDNIRTDIVAFKKDTAFTTAPEDSTLQDKYVLQVEELTKKWERLDSCARKSIIKIGLLQNKISALSILMIDLDDRVDIKISQFVDKAIGNEHGFIWDMHKQQFPLDTAIARTYNLNYRLYKYFLTSKSNYWPHIACIVLLIAFFAWVYNSRRKIKRIKFSDAKRIFGQTHYVSKYPFVAALGITSVIAPYFYDHPPQVLAFTMVLIMMLCIGVLIRRNWPKPLFTFWIILSGITVVLGLGNLLILITYADRLILLVASAIAIYASFVFLRFLKVTPASYPPYIELVVKAFITLQIVSLILNITGRFSFAKIAAYTGTFNLCLAMGFYLFVQILLESLFLQLEANKTGDAESSTSYLDFKVLQKKFKDVVVKVAILLWLVALAKNMLIDDFLYDQATDFLTHSYKFSSTAFTIGSILIFVIIIWLSGLLARVISYLYDFAGQQTKLTPQAKKTRSSILLIRLTIFVIGFFVAVTAAGIPMTQVTIVIGALGVGIGFGLQNIVNNLVSGVILAFEKPVQVGDVIEVSGKSGTITEIGIRSSKIDCGNGSELIVPNGDLISQHVVNWTLTNNNRQVEILIGVAYGSELDKVQEILKAIINNHEEIMKLPAPGVILNNFGESSIDYKVTFWADDISKWASIKSNVMAQIYTEFGKAGIQIPHPKRDLQVFFPEGMGGKVRDIIDLTNVNPIPPKENPSGSNP